MASEAAEASEFAAFMDGLMRDIDPTMFIPFFLGLVGAAPGPHNPDEENPERSTPRERIVIINSSTQRMVVIEGDDVGLDSLFQELGGKNGQPPASKASIDAMPSVKIVEGCDGEAECVICLEQFEVDGVAKEMPCKHRFHSGCIEKWLKLHGSCPVCRYTMPVEEEELGKKSGGDDDEGREERRVDGEFRASYIVHGSRRAGEDSDQTPSADFNSSDDSSSPAADHDYMAS